MSSVSRPFGLRAVSSPSGIIRPTAYSIASGLASNILSDQPVALAADGTITPATVGGRAIGTFSGVEYVNTQGRLVVDNKWISGTVVQAGTTPIAYVTLDPSIIYEIQANGPVTTLRIGEQANFTTPGAGSTVTGLSEMMLDTATFTAAGNATLRVIGITSGADNVPGDAFTIVQVQIAQHQNVADRVAY